MRKIWAARSNDAAAREHVHELWLQVIKKSLIVRDHQHAELWRKHRVHALRNDAQRIDVETGVSLVEDRHLRLQQRHLQHLEALLLAAGESIIHVARHERFVHLQLRELLLDEFAELTHRHAALHWVRRIELRIAH